MRKVLTLLVALAAAFAFQGTAAAQPPRSSAAIAVTPSFLVGRWTDDGNCANAVDFFADGRFRTTNGAEGRWTLQSGRLSFIGQQTITATVHATSRNAITLTHADGTVGASTRCAAPRRLVMPPLPASPQAALAMGGPATRELLLGSWTDTGDCAETITFHRDGRFVVPTGQGTWSLVGDRLTFTGQSVVSARLRAVGQDRILLIHDDQSLGQSLRC